MPNCYAIVYKTDCEMNPQRLSAQGLSTFFREVVNIENEIPAEGPELYQAGDHRYPLTERVFRYINEISMSQEDCLKLQQKIMELPLPMTVFLSRTLTRTEKETIDKDRQALFRQLENNIVNVKVDQFLGGSWKECHFNRFNCDIDNDEQATDTTTRTCMLM